MKQKDRQCFIRGSKAVGNEANNPEKGNFFLESADILHKMELLLHSEEIQRSK